MASAIRGILNRIAKAKDHDRADSLADSEGSRNLSRHSSIQGPYRAGIQVQDTTFPHYRTIDVPVRTGDIFARSLFSLGHGVGLHNVIGDLARPAEHRYNGAYIGDIGTISNVPGGFVPWYTPISEDDTTLALNFFEPGSILATEGVQVSRIPESTTKVRFNTSAREGAVLVLPTGSAREEFVDPSRMYPYFKEHAASWYRYYNGTSDTIAPDLPTANGTLWAVVGVDRVTTWATATFPVRTTDVGKPRDFIFNAEHPESPWEDHSGQNAPDFQLKLLKDGSQGAIFLRVVAIALSPSEWSRHVAYIPPESVECYSTLPVPVVGRRARAYYSVPRLSHFSKRNFPDIPEVAFHPSIPLLHILILTDPTAQVAVIPDSVWISQLSNRHLTHPEFIQLVRRVINNFNIVNTDGLITFVPREENEGNADAPNSKSQRKYQVWVFHHILSWLRREQDDSLRSRALRNMSKVLSV